MGIYNLLIVDDEKIILDSYYEVLREAFREELNIEKCLGSVEAIKKLPDRVDILVTDIFMPQYDGFQLANQFLEAWSSCRVIFITGDETLDNAQKAIRTGFIDDYVLKLESPELLIHAVKKSISILDNQHQTLEWERQISEKFIAMLPIMKKNLLMDILLSEIKDLHQIEKDFKLYHMDFSTDRNFYLLMGIINTDQNQIVPHSEVNKIFLFTDQAIGEYCHTNFNYLGIVLERGSMLWLIQPKQPDEFSGKYINSFLDIIQNNCIRLYGKSITFIQSHHSFPLMATSKIYKQFSIAENRYSHMDDSVIFIEDLNLNTPILFQKEDLLLQLKKALLKVSQQEFQDVLNQILHVYPKAEGQLNIFSVFTEVMTQIGLATDQFNEICATLIAATAESNIPASDSYLKAAAPLFQIIKNHDKNIEESVDRILTYIQNHLSDDLSLNTMAAKVYHSPTYFSKLFKRTVGIGYCEYVSKKRLQKAAQLLKETNLKNYQIMEEVGFDSPSYFIRMFRKVYGCTPQEYKDSSKKIKL